MATWPFSAASRTTPVHFAASRSAARSGTCASSSGVTAAGKRWRCNRQLSSDEPATRRDDLKAYMVVTGTIFGLFAARHLLELVARWRSPASDPWFMLGMAVIVVVSGGVPVWAVCFLRGKRPAGSPTP